MTDQNKPSVLISGADGDLVTLVEYVLQSNGFITYLADDAERTLRIASERNPSLILLDEEAAPSQSAAVYDDLRREKSTERIPVVVMGKDAERMNDSFSDAESFLTKPISPTDLVDRLRLVLKQSRSGWANDVLRAADIELNPKTYRVHRDGRPIHLAPIEFRLLRHLMRHPEQVFTRDELANAAWRPGMFVGPRTVDVHIGRLRRTLRRRSKLDPIRTVRSVGYSFVE